MASRTGSSGGTFQALSASDFSEIERLGKVRFERAIRASLNDDLEHLCSVEGDDLRPESQLSAARLLASIKAKADQLASDIHELQDDEKLGARLARKLIFPVDGTALTFAALASGQSLTSSSAIRRELDILSRRASRIIPAKRPGRPKEIWMTLFVHAVADAYENAGGTVSASYQQAKSKRETPFLRALRYVHSRLPPARQVTPASRVDTRAREVIKGRNRDKVKK